MAVVYRHRRLDTFEVFYVGVGRDKKRAYDKIGRTDYWKRIVKKHGYKVEIIAIDLSYIDANELEMLFISEYGRKDLGGGNLVNMTDGGDGSIGRIVSKETRDKISKSSIGKKLSKETIRKIKKNNSGDKHYNWGKKVPDISRLNMSISHIGLQVKKVSQYDLDGVFIKYWASIKEASNHFNIDNSSISKCCKGISRQCGGFVWKYKNSNLEVLPVIPLKREVNQYDLEGNFIKNFKSMIEAKLHTGSCNISLACSGVYMTSGGFIWEYA